MAVQYLEYGVGSTPITGRYLAHNKSSTVMRCCSALSAYFSDFSRWVATPLAQVDQELRTVVAYDYSYGELGGVRRHGDVGHDAPTVLQSAWLARVNVTYVHHALKQAANRFWIEHGYTPLGPPRLKEPQLPVPMVDDADIIDIVRKYGIARTLDACCAVEAAQ